MSSSTRQEPLTFHAPADLLTMAETRSDESTMPSPAWETIEQVFADLESPLLGYARRLLGDFSLAEDIVQDAFMKLHAQFRQIRAPERWLYRTVHNLAVDYQRRASKVVDFHAPDDTLSANDPTDSQPLPDEQIARWEGIGLVRLVSRKLSMSAAGNWSACASTKIFPTRRSAGARGWPWDMSVISCTMRSRRWRRNWRKRRPRHEPRTFCSVHWRISMNPDEPPGLPARKSKCVSPRCSWANCRRRKPPPLRRKSPPIRNWPYCMPVSGAPPSCSVRPAPFLSNLETPVPMKLSAERRERLLAHFKTVPLPTAVARPRRDRSWIVPLGVAAALITLIGGALHEWFGAAEGGGHLR